MPWPTVYPLNEPVCLLHHKKKKGVDQVILHPPSYRFSFRMKLSHSSRAPTELPSRLVYVYTNHDRRKLEKCSGSLWFGETAGCDCVHTNCHQYMDLCAAYPRNRLLHKLLAQHGCHTDQATNTHRRFLK